MKVKWTPEMLQALKTLAELSIIYRPNGQPMTKRNWEDGMAKMKSQNFAQWKKIKDIPLKGLIWTWSKYQNVCYGFCATTMCGNRIDPGEFYCKVCKPMGSGYHRGIYAKPYIQEHKDMVRKVIAGKSGKELENIIIARIDSMPYNIRRELLGEPYKDMVKAEEQKKIDTRAKLKKAK